MRHLASDHVDFVRMGSGDDHIRIARSGFGQNIRIARKTRNALYIQRIRRTAHQLGVVIHHRYVVTLTGKMSCNLPANLTSAANNDLHVRPLLNSRCVCMTDRHISVNATRALHLATKLIPAAPQGRSNKRAFRRTMTSNIANLAGLFFLDLRNARSGFVRGHNAKRFKLAMQR